MSKFRSIVSEGRSRRNRKLWHLKSKAQKNKLYIINSIFHFEYVKIHDRSFEDFFLWALIRLSAAKTPESQATLSYVANLLMTEITGFEKSRLKSVRKMSEPISADSAFFENEFEQEEPVQHILPYVPVSGQKMKTW